MALLVSWLGGFVIAFALVGCGNLVWNEVDHQMNKTEPPRMSNAEMRGECTGSTPNPPYSGGCTWAGQPDLR